MGIISLEIDAILLSEIALSLDCWTARTEPVSMPNTTRAVERSSGILFATIRKITWRPCPRFYTV